MDYNASVGQTTPNAGTTINIGVIWPTWDSVNHSAGTWLRATRIQIYQCPSDPSLNNGLDWTPGDASYAGNFQVFGGSQNTSSNSNWDGHASVAASFQDGTSNTILFAEKSRAAMGPARRAALGGCGVYHGYQSFTGTNSAGSDDSFPGHRLSAVFAGGVGIDLVACG